MSRTKETENLPIKKVYVAFSKKITATTLYGFFVALVLGMAAIALLNLNDYEVAAFTNLLGTYATIVGVVVSGYFGRAIGEDIISKKNQETTDEADEG